MPDNDNLTPAEQANAAQDIASYRPTWARPTLEVSFLSVARARAAGDLRLLSLVSLQLALRDARIDEGGSVAVVPGPLKGSVPPGVVLTTRLAATWTQDGRVGRGVVYVLVGVTFEAAKRLRSRGENPWMVYCGPETGGSVRVLVGDRVEDVGPFGVEMVLGAVARGVGVEAVEVERRAETFNEALLQKRVMASPPDSTSCSERL